MEAEMNDDDRVRNNTSDETNKEIDRETAMEVQQLTFADAHEVSQRIIELDAEWDVERMLETNASVIALSGLVLGLTHNKKWLAVPGVVLPFLLQHAIQGWCPPVPVLRKLGFRTRKEIDKEKYALKYLRGDFAENTSARPDVAALRAVELGS